jgi:hypothetical protein
MKKPATIARGRLSDFKNVEAGGLAGGGFGRFFLLGLGLLFLGFEFFADDFQNGHFRAVTDTHAGWNDAGIATGAVYNAECAGLRYASEGGALLVRSRGVLGKMLGVAKAKRPQPWLPHMVRLYGAATES